jgi:AcrR family transcriptional regulator
VIATEEIGFPLADNIDLLVVLSAAAYSRYQPELGEHGRLIVDSRCAPDSLNGNADRFPVVDTARTISGSQLVTGVVALGVLQALAGVVVAERCRDQSPHPTQRDEPGCPQRRNAASRRERDMKNGTTTRERIRREAAALFREKGFNGASMAELAVKVGITKSSLYHHYRSKQSLLSEIIEVTVDRVAPLVEEVAQSDLPIRERLGRAVALHTVEAIHDQDSIACFVEEGRYLAPDFMAAHVAKRDSYELIFRRMFEEGIASGEFMDQDVGLAVKAILGMCNSVVRWYRPDGGHTPEQIAAQFAYFAVRGAAAARDLSPSSPGSGT